MQRVFPEGGMPVGKGLRSAKETEERILADWKEEYADLVKAAGKARKKAYAPYSGFKVGAALLTEDGTVIKGCNVENASYPVGICAERNAFSHAIYKGYQKFSALAIAGAPAEKNGSDFCAPCGMCRQFIREFCSPDFPVILAKCDENGEILEKRVLPLEELLPESFGPENLIKK